jgi:hypothetical protein
MSVAVPIDPTCARAALLVLRRSRPVPQIPLSSPPSPSPLAPATDQAHLPLLVSSVAAGVPPMEPFAPSYAVQHYHQTHVIGESIAALGWLRLPSLRGDAAAARPAAGASSPESLALRDAVHGDARDVWGSGRGSALMAAVDAAGEGPLWPLGSGLGAGGAAPASGGGGLPPAAFVPAAAEAAAAVGGRAACAAAGAAARERQAAAAAATPPAPARGAASPWLRPRFHPAAGAAGATGTGAHAAQPRFHWPTGAEHALQALQLPVLPPEPALPPLRAGFSPRTAELLASLEAFKAGSRIMEEARAFGARSGAAA